jgi:serine/threonine protein kinase
MQPTGATTRARKPLHSRLQAGPDSAPTPIGRPARSAEYSILSTQYSVPCTLPWRLTFRLSSAGRQTVYRAASPGDIGPGCYVLKAAAQDDLSRALLRRETDVANNVNHANLITVLASEFETSQPHVVLPYLEGIALRRLLQSSALPVGRALGLIRQVAAALSALHAACWLHGQVRPEHVIVSPQGQATLIDLTQARRLESSECDTPTQLSATAHYAAPECFLACGRINAVADIYSLGAMLFEALAGQPPFVASSPRELAHSHRREIPPNLRQIRSDISMEVSELCRRMLSKEPLRRPSADQVVRWLAELEIAELSGAGILACHD